MGWVFAAGAVLVAASWWGYRKRLAALRDRGLTDDAIRGIESHGRVDVEEPLDLEDAAEEEERFWSESWDEPEPW
jgi:hypothetical protein